MIRLLFPALYSLLLLLLYNIPSIVVVVARDLPLQVAQPRVLAHASSRGFHRHLTLHEQDVFGRWTTRFHNVRLHGGIVAVGEYYARVKIGGQTLRVQIDTGSATLAVPMKECKNCRKGDMRYSVEKSNSGKALILSCSSAACETDTCRPFGCGACSSKRNACCALSDKSKCAFHLSFGDGSGAKGVLVRDVLQFGQDKFPVTFGGIREDSPDFERKQVDGILGMAYPLLACNPSCVKPTFESAMDFLKLKNLFTICMTGSDGRIILGDFDASLNKTAITWVPMHLSNPPTFYDVKLLGKLKIGTRHVELPSYRKAIVDSGTTLIVFSHEAFNMILKHLQTHYCHIPGLCNRKTWFRPAHCVHISDHYRLQLPTLVFRLQGFNVTLDASEYMINYKSRGPEYWCVGLMALDSMSGGVDVIFGNTVMKKYLTIYDRQNKRLGFAETYGTCSGKTPTTSIPQKIPAATHHPTPIGLGKKHKSKNHANATNKHCAVAKTCAKCAKISSPNCFWDTAGSRCVPGEPTRFMCFIDGVAGKVGYFVGGVIGIATLVVAVLAVAICTYKKRQTAAEEAAVDAEERESVMQPLTRDPS